MCYFYVRNSGSPPTPKGEAGLQASEDDRPDHLHPLASAHSVWWGTGRVVSACQVTLWVALFQLRKCQCSLSLRRPPSWPFSAGWLSFISFIPSSWCLQTLSLQTQPSLPSAAAFPPPRRRMWTQWCLLSHLPCTPILAHSLCLSEEGRCWPGTWGGLEGAGQGTGGGTPQRAKASQVWHVLTWPGLSESPRRCCLPGKEVWPLGEGQEGAEITAAAACTGGASLGLLAGGPAPE